VIVLRPSDEVSKWSTELASTFSAASAKLESASLTGAQIATWDIGSEKPWGEHLAVSNPYFRAAMWASWKQALRRWQETQQKK